MSAITGQPVVTQAISLGSDPEFFITSEGKVVGSERLLGEKGQQLSYGKLVRDGVQVELQTVAETCRGRLGNKMKSMMMDIEGLLNAAKLGISLETVVDIEDDVWETLPETSKALGCSPSLNVYDNAATIGVDPATYRARSAGGHIHMGGTRVHAITAANMQVDLVMACDILMGNLSVLLDRSPRASERRQVYGRAGEYRNQPHGVEYRTLSNFWLRSNPLMSLMMGQARLAAILVAGMEQWDPNMIRQENYYGPGLHLLGAYTQKPYQAHMDLMRAVDMAAIREAINTSNFDLAWSNWKAMEGWIKEYFPRVEQSQGASFSIGANMLEGIEWVIERGIDSLWPKEQALAHWVNLPEAHQAGWEHYMTTEVPSLMRAEARSKVAVR